jgi:maltooligosyltrehalose trehalohydrolase
VCTQNHDQVGNRALGERLTSLVNFESLKLAAGANLLSPFVPLLFMGEEYGETAPFLYVTSHGDRNLAEAVRRGRAEEFRSFRWKDQIPDPQAESTFDRSRLKRNLTQEEPHRTLLRFYQMLLRFRREYGLGHTTPPTTREFENSKILLVFQDTPAHKLAILFNFGDAPADLDSGFVEGHWEKKIDSSDLQWLGPGTHLSSELGPSTHSPLILRPRSFAVFQRTAFPSES